jgi:hypothetical protein
MKALLKTTVLLCSCFILSSNSFLDQEKLFKSLVSSKSFNNDGKNGKSVFNFDHTRYDKETNDYFKEIVFGTEFGGKLSSPYKWKKDMKIYIDGQQNDYLVSELKNVVKELNDIINPINIKIVSLRKDANFFVFFGNHQTFDQKYNLIFPQYLKNNWGYFELYIDTGVMYVDVFRARDIESQKHLIREELTQSLGLVNDSWKYENSIFYQGWTTTNSYSEIDIKLIDLLYN